MISTWIIWLIASGILLVGEMLTGTIASLCLAVGCLGGCVSAAMDLSLAWQIGCFVILTALSFVFLRPLLRKIIKPRNTREYRTNMDALIGRIGKVTHEVTNNFDDKGRVQIDGDSWLAYTDSSDVPIPRGTQVKVESYDSLVIRVKRAANND